MSLWDVTKSLKSWRADGRKPRPLEGQVVLLSGEPGIGKSHLTAALMDHVSGQPHTRLRYLRSPQHIDSALYPIIGQMERAAGFTHEDTPRAKLDKLHALLAKSFTFAPADDRNAPATPTAGGASQSQPHGAACSDAP